VTSLFDHIHPQDTFWPSQVTFFSFCNLFYTDCFNSDLISSSCFRTTAVKSFPLIKIHSNRTSRFEYCMSLNEFASSLLLSLPEDLCGGGGTGHRLSEDGGLISETPLGGSIRQSIHGQTGSISS